ncbi:hypothetical protein [Eggerthella sinensis]|uniref:hypothetical protein n=1 Tax=Eggerthella sinensis TaxID=242230 RepID=UPI0022E7AD52|nr:hypothetical protein [Eggerthella sinensis]
MNAKRTALLALTAAALCCALAGCTSPFDAARSAWLYDDDEAIAQQDDAYSVVLCNGPQLDGASTLEGIHIGGLSGSMTLLAFDVPADGGDLVISCDLEAVHGDIKLAFVAFDDEQVETLCEGEASGGLARTLAPGRYASRSWPPVAAGPTSPSRRTLRTGSRRSSRATPSTTARFPSPSTPSKPSPYCSARAAS